MRILITGATGFLGSYLVKHLIDMKYEIVILKRSFSNVNRIQQYLTHISVYDIDKCNIHDILNKEDIDVIIHTATSYGAEGSLSSQIDSNILFPITLLEAAKKFNIRTFINTDTFFNKDANSSYKYLNAYTKTKRYFLDFAKEYCEQNKVNLINVRLEHLYGPNDNGNKFTMNIIKNLMSNVASMNLSPGDQKRDFIYIEDAVTAYYSIISNLQGIELGYSEYELGTGVSISIQEFVELVKRICNSDTELIFGGIPHRDQEIMNSYANISKLASLGWKNETTIEIGIRNIVDSLL